MCNDFSNCRITQIFNILAFLMFNNIKSQKLTITAILSETAIVQFLFGPSFSSCQKKLKHGAWVIQQCIVIAVQVCLSTCDC